MVLKTEDYSPGPENNSIEGERDRRRENRHHKSPRCWPPSFVGVGVGVYDDVGVGRV